MVKYFLIVMAVALFSTSSFATFYTTAKGRVVDGITRKGVKNLTITFSSQSGKKIVGKTDKDGRYQFPKIKDGLYYFSVSKGSTKIVGTAIDVDYDQFEKDVFIYKK